ncbi:MAG: uroporphyrinogen-III synthase, partial [Myxococcales bacterium]|nr:uroporphyrinogen-III synthase [Myxococcales bacterium]
VPSQDALVELLAAHARAGRHVVWLRAEVSKAVAEEARARLQRLGVDFEILPGVPSTITLGELASAEHRPLLGRRVVVTRSAQQARGLVRRLTAVGADAVVVPCLDFAEAEPEDQALLDRALADRRSFTGLIISSPNGADALFTALERSDLDVRDLAGLQVAAIGSGTAARCRSHGLRPDIVPKRARSEGLVDALRQRGLLGGRWLQLRADEGRDVLGEALAAAGGELLVIVAYRSIRPVVSDLLLQSLRAVDHGGRGYDAVAFASGRTARHYLELTAAAFGDDEARAQLAAAKVVAIGPVTADAIAALGLRVDAVAEDQSERGIVDALIACL